MRASDKSDQTNQVNAQQYKVKKQDPSWPFPPPGGPQGPLKQTRSKKAVVQTQEFDQAPF